MKTINIKDINDVLQIVEIQREISVNLTNILERTKRNNKALNDVKNLTTRLVDLKQKHKTHFNELKSLTEDEQKQVNRLLRDRYIKI